VDDVLDYSKIQAGKMELSKVSFEPALEIQNSARMFRSRISEKNLKLTIQLPSQRWFILGDPARFKMIVINLLR
jgi:signal transduction histidine kinase